jgi:lipopolysaccharide transport system permease protein
MWIIGHPLFQMCLFVFIFAVVFQQKIGGNRELPRDYTTYILTGLVPWLAMVPVFTGACSAIIANSNLIKQFSFEAEVLPIKDVALSMVFWVVGVVLIVVYQLFIYVSLPWTLILLPLVLAMHLATMLGVALLLAAITVFVRDVKDIMVLVVSAGVYVLPIVYLPTWVPPIFRPFLYANPFSYLIWVYQDVFYFGRIEHPASWAISAILSLLSLSIGYRVFHRLQPIFGNAL